jgi:hypothetical protein
MHGPRQRVVLEVVDHAQLRGFVVPARPEGGPAFRGMGAVDYACGQCARLLAIGVRRGLFMTLVFRCGCGAMNRVPWRAAAPAVEPHS